MEAEAGKKLVAGMGAGLFSTLAAFPLDTIKTRLSVHSDPINTNLQSVATSLVRREGIRGFFKGVLSPLLATPPIHALSFASWGVAQSVVHSWGWTDENGLSLSPPGMFAAGLLSGSAVSFLWTPMELVKKNLQIQKHQTKAKFTGVVDCVRSVVASAGLPGLYRSFPLVLVFYPLACGVYYGSYDILRSHLNDDPRAPSPGRTLLAGSLAGMASRIVFPLDAISARIMVRDSPSSSFWATAKYVYGLGGIRAFTSGWMTCILRSCVADGAVFFAYELIMRALRNHDDPDDDPDDDDDET